MLKRLVSVSLFLSATALLLLHAGPEFTTPRAQAQPQANANDLPEREPGHVNIRRRNSRWWGDSDPYWEGFELKSEGRCDEATEKLEPIARQGRGFEEAQHALGVCLMVLGGMPTEANIFPDRKALYANSDFRLGVTWVVRAADAGSFEAQGTLIRLYAANLGPDSDPVQAAKWAELYRYNPIRLGLGAPMHEAVVIERLEASIERADLLEGRELARSWTPVYWKTGGPPPPGDRGPGS